jgi:hypothetical protein
MEARCVMNVYVSPAHESTGGMNYPTPRRSDEKAKQDEPHKSIPQNKVEKKIAEKIQR